MYRVSVIMPVYNNEKTLKQAIESVLNQTVYDLELILVNDGSTDTSAQICEEYAKKEPLLIEVIHQKRSGFGLARNKGLFKASGNYIYFADPTHTFHHKMLEDNFNLAVEKDVDLVVFGFTEQNENNVERKMEHLPRIPDLPNQAAFRNHYRNFHHFFPYTLHNKLYRRDYLKNNRNQFHKIPLKETAFFNLSVYKNLGKVAFNRQSYCTCSTLKMSEKNIYQDKLYEVNIELAKYFEAVMEDWDLEDNFHDLIVKEYYHALYTELENVGAKENGLSIEQQENRMNSILEDEKIKQYLKDLKVSNEKTPYKKAVLAALQNSNGKAAVHLVTHKGKSKKAKSKLVRLLQKVFRR